jgi:hypothetical protein
MNQKSDNASGGGDSDQLLALYREISGEQPSARHDAAILAAARTALAAKPARGWWPRWRVPLALAATVVLTTMLTLTVEREQSREDDQLRFAPASPPAVEKYRETPTPSARSPVPESKIIEEVRDKPPEPQLEGQAKRRDLKSPSQPLAESVEAGKARALRRAVTEVPVITDESGAAPHTAEKDAIQLKQQGVGDRVLAAPPPPPPPKLLAPAAGATSGIISPLTVPQSGVPPAEAKPATAPPPPAPAPAAPPAGLYWRILPSPPDARPDVAPGIPSSGVVQPSNADSVPVDARKESQRLHEAAPVSQGVTIQGAPNRARSPQDWVTEIRALRRAGHETEAKAELKKLRLAYPDYNPPEDLRDLKPD